MPTTRSCTCSATRPPITTSTGSVSDSAAWCATASVRRRWAPRSSGSRGCPRGRSAPADPISTSLDPETNEERPRARFDDEGRLLNAEEAIGEIVNKDPSLDFEGYYKNPEANAKRRRNGWYWSGDLGYRDADGWFYFAGRDDEWVRVDGENFGVAPVERILARYPGVQLASVYAVPDEEVGDQLMAALQLDDPDGFDPEAFDAFLGDQSDLGTKWTPRYIRVTGAPCR